jgi:hypothetical protein
MAAQTPRPSSYLVPLETTERVLDMLNTYEPHDRAIEQLANEVEQQRIELLTCLAGTHPGDPERANL